MKTWSILYRGPLSSCNYGCDYCPFAKTTNTRAELRDDEAKLVRLVGWVAGREESIGVLFTPWGEALFHRAYQRAIARLSHLSNVRRVSIQTNLSARLGWLADCAPAKVALWTTFHPSQTTREKFLAQCAELDRLGIAHSVGTVGTKDAVADIEALRRELNPRTYLWVNAYKRQADYYSAEELARLEKVDPFFPLNNRRHPSLGESCRSGASVFSVDGEGTMRRCHFIRAPIGNIYAPGFESALRERPCTNAVCGCHIGYVHLDRLDLYGTFGEGVLERIPIRTAPVHPSASPGRDVGTYTNFQVG